MTFPYRSSEDEVVVRGINAGDVTISALLPGYDGPVPTYKIRVLEQTNVKLTAYVVSNDFGGYPVLETEDVEFIIEQVNQIYKQVGIHFNLEWPSRPEAELAIQNQDYYVIDDVAELQQLQSSGYNTGGVEVYFTRRLKFAEGIHWTPPDYVNPAQGLTVGVCLDENGDSYKEPHIISRLVAHELGHACDLDDIYIENDDGTAYVPVEIPKYSWMQDDWNNGPGPQYYNPEIYYSDIIEDLLMFGIEDIIFGGIDIPYGRIRGIDYYDNFTDIKAGLIDMNRTPEHW